MPSAYGCIAARGSVLAPIQSPSFFSLGALFPQGLPCGNGSDRRTVQLHAAQEGVYIQPKGELLTRTTPSSWEEVWWKPAPRAHTRPASPQAMSRGLPLLSSIGVVVMGFHLIWISKPSFSSCEGKWEIEVSSSSSSSDSTACRAGGMSASGFESWKKVISSFKKIWKYETYHLARAGSEDLLMACDSFPRCQCYGFNKCPHSALVADYRCWYVWTPRNLK